MLAADIHQYPDEALSSFPEKGNLEFRECDIRDGDWIENLFRDNEIESVIHAAAVTIYGPEEIDNPELIMDANAKGSLKLMDAAFRDEDVEDFVYVSSSGVYGDYGSGVAPVHEKTPYSPGGFYIAAKIYSELVCRRFNDFSERPFTVTRIGSPYGPWERPTGAREKMSPIHKLIHAGYEGREMKIYGRDYLRDWTHMEDIARGVVSVSLAEKKELKSDVYNVASGVSVSIGRILEKIEKLTPSFEYRFVEDEEEADLVFRGEYNRGPLDVSRIREDCGFEHDFDIESGLEDYVEWINRIELSD